MPKLRSFKMIVQLKECAKKFIFCSRIYQWCIYKSKCLCFMHQSAPACQYLEALTLLSESYGSSEKCFQTTGIFLLQSLYQTLTVSCGFALQRELGLCWQFYHRSMVAQNEVSSTKLKPTSWSFLSCMALPGRT